MTALPSDFLVAALLDTIARLRAEREALVEVAEAAAVAFRHVQPQYETVPGAWLAVEDALAALDSKEQP